MIILMTVLSKLIESGMFSKLYHRLVSKKVLSSYLYFS